VGAPPGSSLGLEKKLMKTERFQWWDMSGRGYIVGAMPILEGIEPEEFIELDVDERGRVVAVREWLSGCAEPLTRKPSYDASGRIKFSEYTDPSEGNRYGRNAYEYDDEGLICARQETDRKGKLVFRTLSKCDAEGRFLEETALDDKRKFVERHVYQYDAEGNRIRDDVYRGGDGKTLSGSYVMTYDAVRRMTRRAWLDADGREQSAFVYVYDHRNLCTAMSIERGGKVVTQVRNTYDARGRRLATDYVDDRGKPTVLERPRAQPKEQRTSVRKPSPETVPEDQPGERPEVTDRWIHAAITVGYHHYENGRYEKAQELFESVSAYRPDNVYALSGVAACALAQGHLEMALNWYDRALVRDPQHAPSLKGRALVMKQLGH
jgi:hypothetical protein